MIPEDQVNKIIAVNNLKDAVELLGGTMTYETVVDSHGKSAKRIIITYNEEEKDIKLKHIGIIGFGEQQPLL